MDINARSVGRVTGKNSTVDDAIRAFTAGELVIIVDDASRENEGDLVVAAEFATAAHLNTMINEGRGLVCVAADGSIIDRLNLPQMVESNSDSHGTAFTVSVDSVATGTGISAADRATTVRAIADPATQPAQLRRPGHIFPLRAVDGGVRVRRGHTEASVDLARLSGLTPAAAICEVLDDEGSAADGAYLRRLARRLDIPLITVAELVAHLDAPDHVEPPVGARLPTRYGTFSAVAHRDSSGTEHLALILGDLATVDAPLVRVHSECLTGDVLGSWRCDCGDQLDLALAEIGAAGVGAVLYVRGHEGRGIGLFEKIKAYALQDTGYDTVEANVLLGHPVDARDYGPAVDMLRMLELGRVRLLSNNPDKLTALERAGIEVELVPLRTPVRTDNRAYLETKTRLLGHGLDGPTGCAPAPEPPTRQFGTTDGDITALESTGHAKRKESA
ncbi:3,4-dihydroxy-2-butanone-4-phosphate synthase [Gordonia sp. KTR9]|uniref:3,4-dihydroxy-2-butanone-4-phosphate synthase n=1 Tax=Gordonia sp. KTR9 TaxID=337191 RepID=UPI00027DE6A0|nr:3,4-dihydroxy-2-butanone-4-phosphate synthase [Gordonia sp. KTR9]AFR50936.1 putative bifunctional 3,4-dihydroxy-2-butanone 4-phosphate synthase / GTP cyclohydrolase II [Gordonia sp. KTR9]